MRAGLSTLIGPKHVLVASVAVVIFGLALSIWLGFTLHKAMHSGSILMIFFLLTLSMMTYWRTKGKKLLYVSGAFTLYALKELILFFDVILTVPFDFVIPILEAEGTHFLSFLVLALFLAGILKE